VLWKAALLDTVLAHPPFLASFTSYILNFMSLNSHAYGMRRETTP
jgi:hypothetical protein